MAPGQTTAARVRVVRSHEGGSKGIDREGLADVGEPVRQDGERDEDARNE